ncbi:hypothetical protein MARBORIA2_19420 [Methanobrevibacter arboriphilus]|uniref:Uncharacterized protein n=1 Tax=Methanobrevibacter arboriphilus TaxID=39441 RepID=A0ACA8R324_METAZ|nr:hypothetical protein MarbSA_08280 [Methanobrevibacter arboriphilus]GLI12852.1 hypothetical protein MARBORIA2_19420 [Methanobrevibacter arboriphilus]
MLKPIYAAIIIVETIIKTPNTEINIEVDLNKFNRDFFIAIASNLM